ncbi:low temperature requirement protein A [Shimia sp.]|uniref:low temperature requirement protein A n=1 Tax=Shimia sp. TaxID=1954381 RepID=UPI003BAC3968
MFYDLIHVVTIFLLGNYLSDHLDLQGFLTFAGVFIALWYAWGELSIFNSIYVSTDFWHRIIMSLMICTVMFMAAAIPAIDGKGWTFFALGFAANRLLMAALYFRARRTNAASKSFCNEHIRNFLIFAAIFAATAFLPKPLAYWVFAAAMVTTQLVYMIPRISVLRFDRFAPRLGHMSERFALLTLIVLGEGFFKLVVTLSEKGIYKVTPDVLVNFVIGGVSMFVMCWIYFDFVGNAKPKDNKPATIVNLVAGTSGADALRGDGGRGACGRGQGRFLGSIPGQIRRHRLFRVGRIHRHALGITADHRGSRRVQIWPRGRAPVRNPLRNRHLLCGASCAVSGG